MKILIFDLETSLLEVLVWSLRQKYIAPDMIVKDWEIISWAAKWLNDPPSKMMFADTRRQSEKQILKRLHALIDEADAVIAHNGDRFDFVKANTRFKANGMKPPSPAKRIDTCKMYQKTFGETSNSLAYLSEKYNKKFKKLKHAKYPGNELWKECRLGNQDAWREMEKYNKHDVLALEELYLGVAPWDDRPLFIHEDDVRCKCGSDDFHKRGFYYTNLRKYQRYQCQDCGYWWRDTRALRAGAQQGCVR
jgi:hypothetical protein